MTTILVIGIMNTDFFKSSLTSATFLIFRDDCLPYYLTYTTCQIHSNLLLLIIPPYVDRFSRDFANFGIIRRNFRIAHLQILIHVKYKSSQIQFKDTLKAFNDFKNKQQKCIKGNKMFFDI